MTRHERIFKALSDTFNITPLNEEIDDFETCLKEQGFKIVKIKPEVRSILGGVSGQWTQEEYLE